MPRKRAAPPAFNGTEQRLLSALDRLELGQPENPSLRKLATLRRLKITISTVAAEAGLSRTLIGHERCQYPRVRAAIKAKQNASTSPRTETEMRLTQARQIAALKQAVRVRDTVLAAYCRRLHTVQEEASRQLAKEKRVAQRKQDLPDPNAVAGGKLTAAAKQRELATSRATPKNKSRV